MAGEHRHVRARPRVAAHATILLTVILVAVTSAFAQPRVVTMAEMRDALRKGDDVTVVQQDGRAIRGTLERIDDKIIELRVKVAGTPASGPMRSPTSTAPSNPTARVDAFPLESLRSLERRRDSVRNGILKGALVGAAIAGGMFAYALAVDANEMDEWAAGYAALGAASTGIGALVGWGVDAAQSRPPIVWTQGQSGPTRVMGFTIRF
jgi:hypothetical protein